MKKELLKYLKTKYPEIDTEDWCVHRFGRDYIIIYNSPDLRIELDVEKGKYTLEELRTKVIKQGNVKNIL